MEKQMEALAASMMARLEADKNAGLLPQSLDPTVVVPIIVTYFQGLWRMALVSYDRLLVERQINAFLVALGL